MASRKPTAFSRDKMLSDSEALSRLQDVLGPKLAQYELHSWLCDGLPAWEACIRISGPPVFRPIESERWLVVTPECLGGYLGVDGPPGEDEDPSDPGPAECYCFVYRRQFESRLKKLLSTDAEPGRIDWDDLWTEQTFLRELGELPSEKNYLDALRDRIKDRWGVVLEDESELRRFKAALYSKDSERPETVLKRPRLGAAGRFRERGAG